MSCGSNFLVGECFENDKGLVCFGITVVKV